MSRTGPLTGEPEPSDSLRAFGAALRAFREHAGLSREEFGAQMNYSAETIRSFEVGRRVPQPTFIPKAERALNALGVLTAMADTLESRAHARAGVRGASLV